MKRKIHFTLLGLLALAFSCSDNEEFAGIDQLSDYAKNFLAVRAGTSNALASPMGAVINRSFQNLNEFAFSGGRIAGDPNEGDTTIIDDPWQWHSCAEITEFDNEDGSHTVIHDYGEGCEEGWGEYVYLMFGKFSETYRYLFNQSGSVFTDEYMYRVQYDNYGGRYYQDDNEWRLNGSWEYAGSSSYDTATNNFSGDFFYEGETEYRYGDEQYSHEGSGETSYNDKEYTMKSGGYRYSVGNDYYQTEVLQPLVYKYSCSIYPLIDGLFLMTYISGSERITYRQGDSEGSFIIEYGNGECDNEIIIVENGKRIKVDLSDSPAVIGPK
jgi:hypothetical protein